MLKRSSYLIGVIVVFAGLNNAVAQWVAAAAAFMGRRGMYDAPDFMAPYTAARLVASGGGHEIYNLTVLLPLELVATHRNIPLVFLHPPFFALLLAPLSHLAFDQAYQVWTAINVGLLVVACWFLWQIAAPLPASSRALIIIGFLTLVPVPFVLRLGQSSFVRLVAWAGAYLFMRQRRDFMAGLALSGLLLAPQEVVPVAIFLAWKCKWRALMALSLMSLVAVLMSVVVAGPTTLLRYPMFALSYASHFKYGMHTSLMFGWNGLLGSTLGSQQAGLETLVGLLLALVSFLVVARVWRGPLSPEVGQFPLQWLLLTIATGLADPSLFLQDTIIFVPGAVAVLCALDGPKRRRACEAAVVGWVILSLGFYPNEVLHVSIFTLYLMGVSAILVMRRNTQGTTDAASLVPEQQAVPEERLPTS